MAVQSASIWLLCKRAALEALIPEIQEAHMPSSSMVTFRCRIKDATSGKHLLRMAWAVNTVWNYCNQAYYYLYLQIIK